MKPHHILYGFALAIIVNTVGLHWIATFAGCLIAGSIAFFIYVNLNQAKLTQRRNTIIHGRPRFLVSCKLPDIPTATALNSHNDGQSPANRLLSQLNNKINNTETVSDSKKDESFVEFLGQSDLSGCEPSARYKRPTKSNDNSALPQDKSSRLWSATTRVDQHNKNQNATSSFISYLQNNELYPSTDNALLDNITGNSIIDEQLGSLLNLFFRDYILTWYRSISSDDKEFPKELYQVIKHSIRSLALQLSSIDKISYITTQLVDELASHLRLYRSALTKLHSELGTNWKSRASIPQTDPDPKHSRNQKESYDRQLYEYFFDYEYQMEKSVCRDHVCMNREGFFDYINHICDILENLLLPNDCLLNTPLRILCRSVLSNMVLDPFVTCFSNPDYLNQLIVWLCKSYGGSTETFILFLRHCDDTDELRAILEMVKNDIISLRGRDTGGDDDIDIKQRLNSLMYVQALIDQRLISSANVNLIRSTVDLNHTQKYKSIGRSVSTENCVALDQTDPYVPQLTLSSILLDNVALSYFIEYMSSIGAQNYAYFYLNVEGFKISAQHQIAEARHGSARATNNLEALREAATDIYRNYLDINGRANFKLDIRDHDMLERLRIKIHNTSVCPDWFDGAQQCVFEIMRNETAYYKSFLRSQQYSQLLTDMGLVRAPPAVLVGTSATTSSEARRRQLRPSSALGIMSNGLMTSSSVGPEFGSNSNSPNLTTVSETRNYEKVAAGVDIDSEDNIALRILLLLVDEVFNLKAKAVWLRRQIVSFLRTVIHMTFGDKMNRKIIDYVEEMTNARAIAAYIRTFRDSFWPNGVAATPSVERDDATKLRTRVAAKYLMMCSLSEEFKRIIGADTSREGIMLVFDMFQHDILNRRLILVLFESFLQQLFPSRHFREVFEHLHSQSLRSKKAHTSNSDKHLNRLKNSTNTSATSKTRPSRHRPTLSLSSPVTDWPREHSRRDLTPM